MEPLGFLGICGASWVPSWGNGSICQFVFPLLGRSWSPLGTLSGWLGGLLGRPGAVLGRLGAVLGALGPSWSDLGGLLGCFGASGRRKSESSKLIEKLYGNRGFVAFGVLFGRLLGLSWGVSNASWAVLGPSWASWTDRSAMRLGGPFGLSWPVVGPSCLRKSNATSRGTPRGARGKPRENPGIGVRCPLKNPQD